MNEKFLLSTRMLYQKSVGGEERVGVSRLWEGSLDFHSVDCSVGSGNGLLGQREEGFAWRGDGLHGWSMVCLEAEWNAG